MKLNPPGSSSDLAVARTIARRLHQRAFGSAAPEVAADVQETAPAPEPAAPRRPAPPPLPSQRPSPPPKRDAERRIEPPPRPEPPRRREPEPRPEPPTRREPESRPAPPRLEPPWSEPPPRRGDQSDDAPPAAARGREESEAWRSSPPEEPAPRREEAWEPPAVVEDDEEDIEIEGPGIGADEVETPLLEGPEGDEALSELSDGSSPSSLEELADDDAPAFRREPESEYDESVPEAPVGTGRSLAAPADEEPSFEAEDAEVEEPGFDQPEIDIDGDLGPAVGPGPYEGAEEPTDGVSPEDLIGDPGEAPQTWEEQSPLDAEVEAAVGGQSAEDLVEVPAPASWDGVADTCLGLAGARGAMLVDAEGQVVTARGDWPNPGPEAIAARLVAMMDRALRDAPTRSVSAPLAGQHLTAWRVPVEDSLFTAVFIGDAPVRADARPPIDDEIRRAAAGV